MASALQVLSLKKSYGELVLFDNISFSIPEKGNVCLVARNGAGKSTLLNILTGKESYDSGEIVPRSGLKTAYLEQEPVFKSGMTILQATLSYDPLVCKAFSAYSLSLKSHEGSDTEAALAAMEESGAWEFEQRAREMLSRLKMTDPELRVDKLSGGETKRVALAGVLACEPDLLILDEPTNHLDSEMTLWLEQYLRDRTGSLLMVTHDRYFLDNVCDEILELSELTIRSYPGNYGDWLVSVSQREQALAARMESDRNIYRKELEWMRRQPQARATKSRSRIEAFNELSDKLSGKENKSEVKIDVASSYVGKKIFVAENISKSFGQKKVIDDFSYTFSRFEKLGIVGDNGTGKSTLLKILTGTIPPDSGTLEVGTTIRFGYYSQQGLVFDDNLKVLDVITDIAETVKLDDGRVMTASQFLNYFLFPPAVQQNFVGRLSGGEKRRLYLCSILVKSPNFLILDEPTNDLDIMTLGVLENYLAGFGGCVIVVSHDRWFMDKVVDHLLVFEGQGNITPFTGSYSRWIEHRTAVKESRISRTSVSPEAVFIRSKREKQGLSYKEQQELKGLMQEIDELETEKATLETELSSGALTLEDINTKSVKLSAVLLSIEEKTMRWIELEDMQG